MLIPKLNVEGSNPFARFGGDGRRGCGGGCTGRDVAGRSWCPARVQIVNREVESTGLAALREWGLFQHLRGSMLCGARVKCALADFGCDLLHWLTACLRGDRVTRRARSGPGPP